MKTIAIISLLSTIAFARFGQENIGVQQKLSACGLSSQSSGQLGGAAIGTLLAAADPCARYDLADKMVAAAKQENANACIDVIRDYVGAEKNFNPFAKTGAAAGPRFCADASKPASAELKGILPQVDPATQGAAQANAKAAATVQQAKQGAIDNGGKSVEQQMLGIGFTDFFVGKGDMKASAGAASGASSGSDSGSSAPADGSGGNSTAPAGAAGGASSGSDSGSSTPNDSSGNCKVTTVTVTASAAQSTDAASQDAKGADQGAGKDAQKQGDAKQAQDAGGAQGTDQGAGQKGNVDFGSCSPPTIKFGFGLDGRKATEGSNIPLDQKTFQHGSALNIAIITQFLCDRLNDQCKASKATVDLCRGPASQAAASQPKGTGKGADAFNAAFGIKTNFAAEQPPAGAQN